MSRLENSKAEAALDCLFAEWKAVDPSLELDHECDERGRFLITAKIKEGQRVGLLKTKVSLAFLTSETREGFDWFTNKFFKAIGDLRNSAPC